MPQSVRLIDAPTIIPLRKPIGTRASQIYADTYIQITPASPEHKVYFSTDGRDPDPWHRVSAGQERTFKYRAPFRLREGPRQVKAMSVSRTDQASSRVTTKAFEVSKGLGRHSTLEEATDVEDSSMISFSSSTMETSDPELYDIHGLSRYRGASDVGRSIDSYGTQARLADIERDRQRYKDILDNNYLEELHSRRKADSDLTERYSSVTTSDVDTLFEDNLREKNAYGRRLENTFSDDETEVSNYFRSRSTSPDKLASRTPARTMYKAGDPPAFWSTTTPRVAFSEGLDNRPATSAISDLRMSDSTRHSYGGLDSRHKGYGTSGTDSILSRQHVSDSYSSPYRRPGADRGRKSPLGEVGYDAGYSFGRGYNKATTEGKLWDLDKEIEELEREEQKKKTDKDGTHHGSDSGDESDKEKKKDKKKKKKKDESEDEDKDKDDEKKNKKDKKKKEKKKDSEDSDEDSDNEKKKEKKKKKKDKDEESGSEDEKKKKKKKKDKDVDSEDDEKEKKKKKKKDKGDESEDEDKKEKKKKKKDKDDDSGDEKKKKKKKDKDSESEDEDKKDKKKKKKDKDDSDDEKDKKKKDKKKDKDTPRSPNTVNKALTTEHGALSFVNDSGTQINFYGEPPEEIAKKVGDMIAPRKQKAAHTAPPGPSIKALPSGGDTFSAPVLPKPRDTPRDAPQSYPPDSARSQADSSAPIIAKAHNQEQHSVGSFFRNLFGMDKKKNKDAPSTVREDTDSGSRGTSGPSDAQNQAMYEQIRQKCLDDGELWEDPDYPAEDASVYYNENPVDGEIEWKRPHEISDDPQMFVGGASRFDVKQGVLGNCWLLAAVASLTTNEKLLHKVVPPEQNFTDRYAGVFRFKFWQYGRWMEVCIDDRLPTSNGELIFMHSAEGNEFWSPLMEKAYAKLCGCYENLSGGLASEAMTDFTGGVTERFNFREELPDNMFQMMLKAYQRKSLMGCSIDAEPGEIEQELDNGLIMGHAYSLTGVKVLQTDNGPVNLVRVRNPWGNDCEWTGAWSDHHLSDEWKDISEEDKKSMGLQFDHDGEFWMSFKDFSTHFQRLEICHLSPDSLGSDDGSTMWTSTINNGAWKKNVSAGGCRNFPKSYYTNPQFRVKITDADDDDEEDVGTIIVGLMQKGRRKLRTGGGGNLTIGYEIFNADGKGNKSSLDRGFFKSNKPTTTSAYINMREVCTRHRLPPAEYCIVITTYEPNEEADYLLRIFSEKPGHISEVDEETSIVQPESMTSTHSAPPNPGIMMQAEKQFQKHGGEDEEIDAYELQDILNSVFTKHFNFVGFDLNLCRSMLAMKDLDHTGKLGLDEFKAMWKELDLWKNTFKKFDADKSGSFNSCELREALKHCGYQVSNATFQSVVMRFSDRKGDIKFDDFVACIVKLATMFNIFSTQFKDGQAAFSLDSFIQLTMYS